MGIFSFLFGNRAKKVQEFKNRGAIVLDVRTKSEYDQGAIPDSKHVPLQQLQAQMNTIKKWNIPVITCCASGVRSGTAASILRSNGVEAMNGGGWAKLYQRLQD